MNQHDLVIIGGGPGGYAAALRAAQLGMDVACVEREPQLGGACLRVGCIPSKAMLESSERYWEVREEMGAHGIRVGNVELDLATMLERKQGIVDSLALGIDVLFKKRGVTRYRGHARFDTATKITIDGPEPLRVAAQHVIIATGSRPAGLAGVAYDGDRIGTSTEALSYTKVPEHLVVIGAGYIGLELGSVWQRLGAKVTVLEYLDCILPGMDREVAQQAQKILSAQGMEFRLQSRVVEARRQDEGCIVQAEGADPLSCSHVLLAVGRLPNTEDIGLERIAVALDDHERILVNDAFETTVDNVYAIGDVVRGPMLAHKAEDEGIACAERLAGKKTHVNYDTIPGVVYTHPEIASVGKSEEALKEAGIEYRKGVFPFSANGRARSLGFTEGRVKVLAHAETDRILGVHIIGPRAGDLIGEAVAAMEYGASSEDLARTCHAHPTLAEALKEAALAVDQRSIHI
jgi:dihydrolipoamide dehydrogenase